MAKTTSERTPVLRKATPAEELARLHPVERVLLRLFEFLASVKLAIILMIWLMVECAVGTIIEAQVNAPAARYFVYGNVRFALLLAFLALNILCAALIRFPWKRYQTGFVITHIGLLIMLAGAMITWMTNVDALMSVALGEKENRFYDPDQELLRVRVRTPDSETPKFTETFPAKFGPFTWGHRIFGMIPWMDGHQESYSLPDGGTFRILNYFANCNSENTYVPSKEGVPALAFRLFHPERADIRSWITINPQTRIGQEQLGAGTLTFWKVGSDAELEHFVKAVPRQPSTSMYGTISYTHDGRVDFFKVEDILKKKVPVPGTDETIEIVDHFNNAVPGPTGKLSDAGGIPQNPAVHIQITKTPKKEAPQGDAKDAKDDKEKDSEPAKGEEINYLAFGAHPQLDALLANRQGRDRLFSYHRVDQPAMIQIVAAPSGRLGYRAFGTEGLIAASELKMNQEYPSWAGLTFVPLEYLPSARPDLILIPKPIRKGKQPEPGVILEYRKGDDTIRTALVRQMRRIAFVDGKRLEIEYDINQQPLPFSLRLDDFEEPKNPGTRQAAMYTSKVTVFDDEQGKQEEADITMNAPLHYAGKDGISYTFYQSGIDHSTGRPISTYTVARDPGRNVIYVGAMFLCGGIFLMFYMGGYFRKRPSTAVPAPEDTA